MFGKSNTKNQAIQSLIGSGTIIVGNISFSGGLRIDGVVQGNIKAVEGSHSMLVVSEQAKIDGEIHAAHLVVNGTINGPVYATQLVELQPKARVKGDVIYNAIEMHHGAVVAGTLKHQAAQEAQLALPAPVASGVPTQESLPTLTRSVNRNSPK
jgi:cytoskeletal protein CcmA (bactofilin family)